MSGRIRRMLMTMALQLRIATFSRQILVLGTLSAPDLPDFVA
jgi:hypothetical protein